MTDHVAFAETEIEASPDEVWSALTDPEEIGRYMFGSHVESSWEEGYHIVWKGQYEGRDFTDHGKILEIERPRRLRMTHFSPLSGSRTSPRTTTRSCTNSRRRAARRRSG